MSDREDYEVTTSFKKWHLTEAGWVPGTFQGGYDESQTVVGPPPGSLKTVTITQTGSVMFGRGKKVVVNAEARGKKRLIKALEKQFGYPADLKA